MMENDEEKADEKKEEWKRKKNERREMEERTRKRIDERAERLRRGREKKGRQKKERNGIWREVEEEDLEERRCFVEVIKRTMGRVAEIRRIEEKKRDGC